jgi:hypothetical protein
MDALVSDNERVVETSLAVNSKGRDTIVDLDRGGGADESDGRSEKEGKHKKTKRPHDVLEEQGSWKVRRSRADDLKNQEQKKISMSS